MSAYKMKKMNAEDLPDEVTSEKKGWGFVCENHHGVAYWNDLTGEFCWNSSDDGKAKLHVKQPISAGGS